MNRCSALPRRHLRFASASVLPLCLILSACGGGGGSGVASIPPPPPTPSPTPTPTPTPSPTPTPTPAANGYPLTRAGTYDLLGRVMTMPQNGPSSVHAVDPGQFSMTVSKPSGGQAYAYKFDAPAGFLPGSLTSIDYGTSVYKTLPFSADQNIATWIALDAGYSYVSMGEWGWDFVHLDGGTAGGFGMLLFVAGDRTPGSGIPVSGKATYDAHTLALLSTDLTAGIPFKLTADFGQRTISTAIDQNYRYNPQGDIMDYPAPGIHVSGSAAFTNSGTFDIPLSGTANYASSYAINTPQPPPSQAVAGNMNGAFFGPHAEQVGGTFNLQNSGGVALLQDAFVGQRPH